jgi:phage terminase small subunit
MQNARLSPKQRLFVTDYFKGMNATKTAIRA